MLVSVTPGRRPSFRRSAWASAQGSPSRSERGVAQDPLRFHRGSSRSPARARGHRHRCQPSRWRWPFGWATLPEPSRAPRSRPPASVSGRKPRPAPSRRPRLLVANGTASQVSRRRSCPAGGGAADVGIVHLNADGLSRSRPAGPWPCSTVQRHDRQRCGGCCRSPCALQFGGGDAPSRGRGWSAEPASPNRSSSLLEILGEILLTAAAHLRSISHASAPASPWPHPRPQEPSGQRAAQRIVPTRPVGAEAGDLNIGRFSRPIVRQPCESPGGQLASRHSTVLALPFDSRLPPADSQWCDDRTKVRGRGATSRRQRRAHGSGSEEELPKRCRLRNERAVRRTGGRQLAHPSHRLPSGTRRPRGDRSPLARRRRARSLSQTAGIAPSVSSRRTQPGGALLSPLCRCHHRLRGEPGTAFRLVDGCPAARRLPRPRRLRDLRSQQSRHPSQLARRDHRHRCRLGHCADCSRRSARGIGDAHDGGCRIGRSSPGGFRAVPRDHGYQKIKILESINRYLP